jgi:hypothetical protein
MIQQGQKNEECQLLVVSVLLLLRTFPAQLLAPESSVNSHVGHVYGEMSVATSASLSKLGQVSYGLMGFMWSSTCHSLRAGVHHIT